MSVAQRSIASDFIQPIVHETTTQRQHVRLRAPVSVIFEDQHLSADDWSVAGFSVSGAESVPASGAVIAVKLRFTLEGLDVESAFEAEVRRSDHTRGAFAARFVNLTQSQLSFLHAIANAVISGEIVRVGDFMAMAKYTAPTAKRDAAPALKPDARARFARLGLLSCLWIIALGLVTIIVVNGFNRAFVLTGNGVLTSPEASLQRAPSAVTLVSIDGVVGARKGPGALLATVERLDGSLVLMRSPCDCVIAETLLEPGAFVERGTPLLTLVPASTRLWASVAMPLQAAQNVQRGDRAMVHFFTARGPVRARVERITLPGLTSEVTSGVTSGGGLRGAPMAVVTLATDVALPSTLAGQPLTARINTARLPRID
jgi:alginate biosynthesis protein Alg44